MGNELTVMFNGVNLSAYFIINTLDRGVSISKKVRTRERNNKRGVEFLGTNSYLYSFPMDVTIVKELNDKRRKITQILNVDEPKKLVFSDEPNIYYLAYPSISTNISEILEIGKGTITWEIPDGIAYSLPEYTYTNKDTSGVLQDLVYINNPGTEPMELELEASFYSDNGFLGLSSDDGSVKCLFGDMVEVDKTPYEQSEMLFNDHFHTDRGWVLNVGVVPPVTNPIYQQGTAGYKTESLGEGYVYPLDYGTPQSKWSGPSLTKTVPADSNGEYPLYWSASYRMDFNPIGSGSDQPFKIGHQSMTFSDQNGKIIVSIVVEDNHATAEKSDLAIYVQNKRVYDTRNTNDYYITARPGDGNHIYVERWTDVIQVVVKAGQKDSQRLVFSLTDPTIELRKITWYAARWQNYPPMVNNLLRAINVVKHKVPKWKDIPNKFMVGDILAYGKDGRNVFCTVNGLNELRLRDVGSTLITVPPGQRIIRLAYSDFSDTPQVTLKGRARYTI